MHYSCILTRDGFQNNCPHIFLFFFSSIEYGGKTVIQGDVQIPATFSKKGKQQYLFFIICIKVHPF